MKFQDIPQFSVGHYETCVSLDGIIPNIERYAEKFNLDMNPWFQRGHVWTEQQQIAYMEYFLSGGVSGRTIYFNHPGWRSDYTGQMVLMDGLQRLTTVIKFINDELEVFGQTCTEFGGTLLCPNSLLFNVNDLRTEKDIVKWYLGMNSGGTIHSPEEIERVRSGLLKLESK